MLIRMTEAVLGSMMSVTTKKEMSATIPMDPK